MEVKSNTYLKITKDLLMLERGREELLLADATNLHPLYIRRGRKYISEFLKHVSELSSYKEIADHYPGEMNLLDILLRHGIIIPAATQPADKNPSKNSCSIESKRISLFLLLSQSCNMGCIYCFNGKETYQTDQYSNMGKDVAFRSIERTLQESGPDGEVEIIFFGGEPLLNWTLAKDIITYCESTLKSKYSDNRIKYHLTSNLSFIPSDLIEWAKKYQITFLCDVDGPGRLHNQLRPFKNGQASHDVIMRNIRELAAAGLQVNLRTTVTGLNQDYLLEIAEHHKNIGGASSAFVPVNPINSDGECLSRSLLPIPRKVFNGVSSVYQSDLWKDEALYPFNQYKPRLMPGAGAVHGCGAPCGNTVVVDVRGDVYPCIYLVGIRRFYLGNMIRGDYPNRSLLEDMSDKLHVDRMEKCRYCQLRYICGGGCPLRRLPISNKPAPAEIASYWKRITCDYTKDIIESILWNMAEKSALSALKTDSMLETYINTPSISAVC